MLLIIPQQSREVPSSFNLISVFQLLLLGAVRCRRFTGNRVLSFWTTAVV